jgi:hypothetical protein
MKSNPKSDRLQPYKAQYLRLCKVYVDSMKEHQKVKVPMQRDALTSCCTVIVLIL